ncbi:MAG TPA: hypothetical protein VIH00_07865 [Candidatus Limnocylindrales bacterium]
MTVPFADRDGGEIEAFIVDRYLESLLARHPADVEGVPIELRATAQRLAAGLPRHHPSFRFEERLALRLAEVAAQMRLPAAAGAEGIVVPIAGRRPDSAAGTGPAGDDAETRDGRPAAVRPAVPPVVIGGVLTSAAISLAGAAIVAWRRGHPAGDPMARAIRAVSRARTN